MVVGIHGVPEMVSPKRRCSEGSSSLLPRAKRCREESIATHEASELQDPSPSVVLLEENGGIWNVDGLLELLAGALCATLGTSLDAVFTPDGTSASSPSAPGSPKDLHHSQAAEPQSPHRQPQLQPQSLSRSQPQQPQRPPLTVLTERNLRAHTAAAGAGTQQVESPAAQAGPDDEDRTSVASLSAWVTGTQSPRRRLSEGGAQPSTPSSHPGSAGAPASAFSFAVTWQRPTGKGGPSDAHSTPGPDENARDSARWPRRWMSSAAGRQ